jgi:hypothetical protein
VWGILKSMPSALTKKELASLLTLLEGDARPIDTVCIYIYIHIFSQISTCVLHPLSFRRLFSIKRCG